jgi:hypothetical protein
MRCQIWQTRQFFLMGVKGIFDESTRANRVASLRFYCRAASLYPAPARHGMVYCGLLERVMHATQDLYRQAGAAAVLPVADVVLNLPDGGVARLCEPLGRGFIALSEAILHAREALHGAQAPQMAEKLFNHAAECAKYGDFVTAVAVSRRHVLLCSAVFVR